MKQPSEETKLRMAKFFMRTSVPRILAKMEKGEPLNVEIDRESLKSDNKESDSK